MTRSESLISGLAPVLRSLPVLLALLLVIALGWRAAHWTWALIGDHQSVAAPSAVSPVPDAALAQHWFGVGPPPSDMPENASASTVVQTAVAGALSLRGLIAGGPQPLAIIDVAGTSWQVQVGERFADRYVLESISRDELVVDDGGQRRVLSLPVPKFAVPPDPLADAPGAALAPQGALVGQSPNARTLPRPGTPAVARSHDAQRTGRP